MRITFSMLAERHLFYYGSSVVDSVNICTFQSFISRVYDRKLDLSAIYMGLVFHRILLIVEKWNMSILFVWICYSPGFSTAFIVTICHYIRVFLCQRCSEVETPVLNATVGREAEIVRKVMQEQITQLSSACSNSTIKILEH